MTLGERACHGKSTSCQFDVHGHGGSGDKMVLVSYVVLQDHVTKKSGSFVSRKHPAKFDDDRHCYSGDIMVLVRRMMLKNT